MMFREEERKYNQQITQICAEDSSASLCEIFDGKNALFLLREGYSLS